MISLTQRRLSTVRCPGSSHPVHTTRHVSRSETATLIEASRTLPCAKPRSTITLTIATQTIASQREHIERESIRAATLSVIQ